MLKAFLVTETVQPMMMFTVPWLTGEGVISYDGGKNVIRKSESIMHRTNYRRKFIFMSSVNYLAD